MRWPLAIFLLLAACTPPLKNPPSFLGKYDNACLPEAAAMCEGLKAEKITAQVIIFQTDKRKHAICVYLYPTGENKLWGWDSTWKSNQIKASIGHPFQIAQAWINATGAYDETLTEAFNP